MARRSGRPGAWLATDELTGFTKYGTQLKTDFWGAKTARPLKRNLQEIATPLLDPYPVPYYTGSSYEQVPNICVFENIPFYVGNTNIRTPRTGDAAQAVYNTTGIGDMEIGCTFIVS